MSLVQVILTRFQLHENDDQTIVRFTHYNWKEATNFIAHCSIKWAVFLFSLKEVLETGQGKTFPNDIGITTPDLS